MKFTPSKYQLIFICTIIFSIVSFAQSINPSFSTDTDENLEWFWSGNGANAGEIIKIGKVLFNSGNNAKAVDRIRISVVTVIDYDCSGPGQCPDDLSWSNPLQYNIGSGWKDLMKVQTNIPSNWNEIGSIDARDSYSIPYNSPYLSYVTYDCSAWNCWWCECTDPVWVNQTLYHTGNNGAIYYALAKSGIIMDNLVEKQDGVYRTLTFDWVNFPVQMLDGDFNFKWYGYTYNENFKVDYGDVVGVEDMQDVNDDYTIDLIGTGGSLPSCHNTAPYYSSFKAQSYEIYGDNQLHDVTSTLGHFEEGEFSYPVLSQSNSTMLGPDRNIDYKLYYREYDRGCAIQRLISSKPEPSNVLQLSTDPMPLVDNLIAKNVGQHVTIEWSHLTSANTDAMNYAIYRQDDPGSEPKQVLNYLPLAGINPSIVNYSYTEFNNQSPIKEFDEDHYISLNTGDYPGLNGKFIDYTAQQDKSYLYTVKATPNIPGYPFNYKTMIQTTGAGIAFFDDNEPLNILTPLPLCDGFSIEGTQAIINSEVKFAYEDYEYDNTKIVLNEDSIFIHTDDENVGLNKKLSFVNMTLDTDNFATKVLPQRVYFFENSDLSSPVVHGPDNEPLELSGSQSQIEGFELPLDDNVDQSTMYAVVTARRTDGKVFRSFEPREIVGMRKPTPQEVTISSATFEDYVTLRFTDIKDENNVDNIKIFRESRSPEDGASLLDDPDATFDPNVTIESIILDKDYINSMIIENGQLVFYDNAGGDDKISWYPTILCNEYTYYIQSSNCDIWSLDDSQFFQEVIGNQMQVSPTLQQDLFEIGNPNRDLSSSRGEYSHKVHLTWNNNSSGVVDHYTVERRQLGSVGESAWIEIGAVSTGEKYFEDHYCEANLLYEYRIKAHVGNCAATSPDDPGTQANTVSSNMVGFRRPVGRVTGRVIYSGTSNPVEKVYVKVEPIINDDQTNNRSLKLDNSYGLIESPFSSLTDDDLNSYSVSFWMRGVEEEGYLYSRFSTSHHSDIFFKDNKIRYEEYATSTSDVEEYVNLFEDTDRWNNVTMTVSDSIRLYVNGLLGGVYHSTFEESKNNNLVFGAHSDLISNSFNGLMDEIVVWKRALSSEEIKDNCLKFLSTSDDDLVLFVTGDEGIGNSSYDISSNTIDVFNRNHMSLQEFGSNQNYSNPEGVDYFYSDEYNEELLNLGKSTTSGMYDISDIRYISDGNNFSITPFTIQEDYSVVHEFLPSQQTNFIGDISQLLSAIDFQDLTSKTVIGKVLFDVTQETTSTLDYDGLSVIPGFDLIDKDTNPIGVEDVFVKVNGKRVNTENGEVKTEEDGSFTISVPIGNQCLSFEKNGHTFFYEVDLDTDDSNDGKYCQDFTFESDANLPDFSCNTYKTLRGRISGGHKYNNLLIDDINVGFNKPANTIGSVSFTLMPNDATTNDYSGYSVSVETNEVSGEYSAILLPIEHKINSSSWISSNKSVEEFYQNHQYLFSKIDMKVTGEDDVNGDFVEDILTTSNGVTVIETIEYNQRFDITYRNSPSILVSQNISTEQSWTPLVGELEVIVNQGLLLPARDSIDYTLGIPVFKERYGDQTYRYNLEVSEVYKNYGPILQGHDHNSYMYLSQNGESVYSDISYFNPVNEGALTINNTMLQSSTAVLDLSDLNSSIDYEFNPDNPNVFGVNQKFLRKFIIEYQEGTINAKWPELYGNQSEQERGDVLLLGDESYGNDFFTFGPQTVDMILRDPHGDASSSSIAEGTTITRTSTVSNVNGYSKDWSFHVGAGFGVKSELGFSFGAHTAVTLEGQAFATFDAANSASISNSNENEITISNTYNSTIATNSDDWEVGAPGDVFIGESKNLNFGTAKDLTFIKSLDCNLGGGIFTCDDDKILKEHKTYKKRYQVGPENELIFVLEYDIQAVYEIVDEPFDDAIDIETLAPSSSVIDGVSYLEKNLESFTSFQIGTKTSASIKPGVSTEFAFSQNYIENYMIPKLLFIKNTYLIGEYSPNTDLLPLDHECFGEPINSSCFDSYDDQSIRNYYTVPDTESEQVYEIPVLSNYNINTLTSILGSTYTEFQEDFANSNSYINNSVNDDQVNNDSWTPSLLNFPDPSAGILGVTVGDSPALAGFLDFISTGPSFGLFGNSASETSIESLVNNFADVQDFTTVPGFINLESLMSSLSLDSPAEANESIIIPKDKVQFYSQQIKLWARALALNELDKIESEFITNHSFNGGVSIEQSHTSVGSYSNTNTITYELGSENALGGDFSAVVVVLGFESDFAYKNNYSLEFTTSTNLSAESEVTSTYFLNDADQGDALSIDVNESKYGFGPIFKMQAGATSCPWEDAINANYITKFDYYFELKFYEAFLAAVPSEVLPTLGLSFNPDNFEFTFNGELIELADGELPIKTASWVDFSQISKKSEKSAFETLRLQIYDTVKGSLLAEHTNLFGGDTPYELSATTSQRDKPTIDVYPFNLYNVPEEEQAVFNLTLGNESEDNSARIYNIRVLESTNPHGAIIKIDGLSPNRDFAVPAGDNVYKTLTVQKGPDSLSYSNLKLVIYPECQYDFGTSDGYDIADTITFSAHFLPTCTDVTLADNDDDWLVNLSDSNQVSLKLNDYNVNYYSFEGISLDYQFENEPWSPISPNPSIINPNYVINKLESFERLKSLDFYNILHSDFDITSWDLTELHYELEPQEFCVGCDYAVYEPTDSQVNVKWISWKQVVGETDEALSIYINDVITSLKDQHLSSEFAYSDNEMLSLRTSSTNVTWNMPSLPKDGNYKIRAKSNCGSYTSPSTNALEEISIYSASHNLFTDRISPKLFGSIQPTDGILNPNDDVVITFNEIINHIAFNTSSAETYIEVEARKNRTTHTHDSYLYFGSNDSLSIPSGVYFNHSFGIEMWIKPESNGVLFEQSNGDDSEVIRLSITDFDSSPKLQFDYLHPTDVNKSQMAIHSLAISNFGFTHITVGYDSENNQFIFLDGTGEINVPEYDFNMNYISDAPISIGKYFQGAMHDLRLWNVIPQNIEVNRSISLSGNEANLIGYWPMDELILNPKDKARFRHANTSAEWSVDNDNRALIVNSDLDIVLEDDSPISIVNNSDFTIEFWFNSSNSNDQTLISLGSWDDGSKFETWSFDLKSGVIEIYQGGEGSLNPILSSSDSYDDGVWHHFAMVKNASSTTRLYIDGYEQDYITSDLVTGITAPSTFYGVRKLVNNADASVEYLNHFNGFIDEFRVWNISKSSDRIISDMNDNITEKIGLIRSKDFDEVNSFTSGSNIPLIRASNNKTSVSFNDVSNGNQISIEITEPLTNIENTILDFTIQNVKDVSGNEIDNPISWSTYIDRNQLVWQDQLVQKDKLLGESLEFSSFIINQGGFVEEFEISNIPEWLTVYPDQGLLDPNSFAQINFVVNDNLFIGDYNEDLLLFGNNNYGERLELNLNVEALQPQYLIDEQDYEYVMNFVGKVSVEGIRSRDDMDILYAYVNDEIRGAFSPIYIQEYDAYFVFLSVYGDQMNGEEVTFRLWDASEGKFQSRVKINGSDTHAFQPSYVIGSFADLAHFEATNILRQEIILNQGWNWTSFNLNSLDEDDGLDYVLQIPTIMNDVDGSQISIFKNQSSFSQYAEIDGYQNSWIGSLNQIPVTDMYMIKSEITDTIAYEGKIIDPSNVIIDIGVGWNWIGYLGQKGMLTNQALSSLNPSSGDVIKNKSSFSMYASESLGWLGTLNSMESGEGYMLKTENLGSLIYPESSIFRIHEFQQKTNQDFDDEIPVNVNLYEHSMNIVAEIALPEFDQPSLSNILAAYSNDLCVGNINATRINENESLYFITVYGEQGNQVSFKYYNQSIDSYLNTDNSLKFEPNMLIGSFTDPYPIIIDNTEESISNDLFSVYPNPFKNVFEIEFNLENQEFITLDIYDLAGRKISTINKGLYDAGSSKISIDATDITKGSYFIELKLEDSSFRKIIIKS